MFQKLKNTLENLDAKSVGVFLGQTASKACTLAKSVKENPALQSHLQKAQEALKDAQQGVIEGWQEANSSSSQSTKYNAHATGTQSSQPPFSENMEPTVDKHHVSPSATEPASLEKKDNSL